MLGIPEMFVILFHFGCDCVWITVKYGHQIVLFIDHNFIGDEGWE